MPAINQSKIARTTAAETAVIRAEDVHKYYELGETRVHALRGVSVEVRCGEFVALMGASGSGKSTFMNILGCLDRPSSGRYLLEGVDVSQHDKRALALFSFANVGRTTATGGGGASAREPTVDFACGRAYGEPGQPYFGRDHGSVSGSER